MDTPADNLDLLSSDKLASAIANSGEKIASVIAAADEVQREAAWLQSRAIRPFFLAPAPPLRRRRSWLVVMGGIVMLMVAVVVGVVAVGQWSFPPLWPQAGDRAVEFDSSGVLRGAAPRLLVQASPATSGEPAPLGVTLQGRADDAVVLITGLVPGMTLSTGSQIGIDTWRIPTAALPSTWIGPPTSFVGMVDLVAELHLADMTIADRRPIKLEWGAAIPDAAAESPKVETDRTAVAPPPEQNVAPSRPLGADGPMVETAWIGPAANFVGVGDIVTELHLADMTIADRRPIKLEWGAAIPAAAAESPTVETDRTAVVPTAEQNMAPPHQLDAGKPTVETDRTAVEPAAEQNVAPPHQPDAGEPTVEMDRTAVAPPVEHVSPSRQLDADEPTVVTHGTAVALPQVQNVAPSREPDADEIAVLLKRGEDLIRSGDLAAARLVLQRAAEAKSAEAALTLAATYDPVILQELRVYGLASDVGTTRNWYEKTTDRTAVVPPREQDVAPSRQLDADEIAALLKHGENLICNGDLAAARLVLQRAAEAKSAEAALTLAATYDPVILQELRVYGLASNVGMARSWYEKAKEFGSAAASQRLEILASAAR